MSPLEAEELPLHWIHRTILLMNADAWAEDEYKKRWDKTDVKPMR